LAYSTSVNVADCSVSRNYAYVRAFVTDSRILSYVLQPSVTTNFKCLNWHHTAARLNICVRA